MSEASISNANFEQLIAANRQRIQRIARSYAPPGELDDLVQEILLQLWRARKSFRGDAQVHTWLYRVALNTAMSFHRKKRDPVVEPEQTETIDTIGNPVDPSVLLKRFLDNLGVTDRSAMLLFLEGLAAQQIADVLGTTPGAVAVRLSRLKQRFEDEFVEESA